MQSKESAVFEHKKGLNTKELLPKHYVTSLEQIFRDSFSKRIKKINDGPLELISTHCVLMALSTFGKLRLIKFHAAMKARNVKLYLQCS